MNSQTWWYLSRASGIVAWVLLTVACLWGVLMVTRMLKPADRPAWMLDLHRWLGALSVITTGVHLAALVADNYVHFGWAEILVPQASEWKRWPVTMGVIAFYILLVVEASSLLMKKLLKPDGEIHVMTDFQPISVDMHECFKDAGFFGGPVDASTTRPLSWSTRTRLDGRPPHGSSS